MTELPFHGRVALVAEAGFGPGAHEMRLSSSGVASTYLDIWLIIQRKGVLGFRF